MKAVLLRLVLALALLLVALNYAVLGPRGFDKHRSAGTRWPMRWLLAPYRFGAWLNALWWTRGQAPAVLLADGVWIGRLPGDTAGAAWRSTLNLAAELDARSRLPSLHLPAMDLVPPSAAWLIRAARAILC